MANQVPDIIHRWCQGEVPVRLNDQDQLVEVAEGAEAEAEGETTGVGAVVGFLSQNRGVADQLSLTDRMWIVAQKSGEVGDLFLQTQEATSESIQGYFLKINPDFDATRIESMTQEVLEYLEVVRDHSLATALPQIYKTAFRSAIAMGDSDSMNRILQTTPQKYKNMDILFEAENRKTPLHLLLESEGRNLQGVRALLDGGQGLTTEDSQGLLLLQTAARAGGGEIYQYIRNECYGGDSLSSQEGVSSEQLLELLKEGLNSKDDSIINLILGDIDIDFIINNNQMLDFILSNSDEHPRLGEIRTELIQSPDFENILLLDPEGILTFINRKDEDELDELTELPYTDPVTGLSQQTAQGIYSLQSRINEINEDDLEKLRAMPPLAMAAMAATESDVVFPLLPFLPPDQLRAAVPLLGAGDLAYNIVSQQPIGTAKLTQIYNVATWEQQGAINDRLPVGGRFDEGGLR